mmetsp:Transcript_20044/g.51673  ORF Transcript_20044/g.51673 Transcript_20044/m.51673 type:complete len:203 (+) Transcript_20044:245-853(+)
MRIVVGRVGERVQRPPKVEGVEVLLSLERHQAVACVDGREHVLHELEKHRVRLEVRAVRVRDHALRVDDEDAALGHAHCAVRDLVGSAVAEARVERVELDGEERADVLEAGALELLRVAPDHLARERLDQAGRRHEDGPVRQAGLPLLHAHQVLARRDRLAYPARREVQQVVAVVAQPGVQRRHARVRPVEADARHHVPQHV